MAEKATLTERLVAIAGEVERLGHDGQMQGGGSYKYTSINAIADLARPLLAKHGVAVIPGPVEVLAHDDLPKGYHCVIRRAWTIKAGEEEMYTQSIGASADSSDKAYNKAHTYARKNFLLDLLNLSTGEDPDSERPEVGRRERPAPAPRPAKPLTRPYDDVVAVGEKHGLNIETIHKTLKAAGFSVPSSITKENYQQAEDAVMGKLGPDNKGGLPDRVDESTKKQSGKKKTDAEIADEEMDKAFGAKPEEVKA